MKNEDFFEKNEENNRDSVYLGNIFNKPPIFIEKKEEINDSMDIDIETFMKELGENDEKINENKKMEAQEENEDEKKAKKISYLLNLHFVEETPISRCLNINNKANLRESFKKA